jgi:hypothetical protein
VQQMAYFRTRFSELVKQINKVRDGGSKVTELCCCLFVGLFVCFLFVLCCLLFVVVVCFFLFSCLYSNMNY